MSRRSWIVACWAGAWALGLTASAAPVKPPKNPAEIRITVSPDHVAPGGSAEVTVTIAPKQGIKIARYPQIKLQVPEAAGLVGSAETRIGSAEPPPPEQLETNYWKQVDPVKLMLKVDPAAAAGAHEIDAKLSYFFCVAGDFCAPARVPVKIPLAVE